MTDLLETTEGGIAWLTLNRPDRLNAFSPAMLTALGEALQRLSEDAKVGAVIITGAGRGFCAGGDVKTMPARAAQGFECESVARSRGQRSSVRSDAAHASAGERAEADLVLRRENQATTVRRSRFGVR